MKMKIINYSLILCIICICFLVFVIRNNQSPYEYLKKKIGDSTGISVNEFLYQANLSKNEIIIFYINGNYNVSCAVVKKNLIFYDILVVSSELLLKSDNSKADYLFSSYNGGNKWIDWGVIRDDNIKQVIVDNRKANLSYLKKYGVRICYLFGEYNEGTIPPNHQLVY